jgi:hypothetical protein
MQKLISLIFGLILVGFGVHLLRETLEFRREGVTVSGTVVALESRLEFDEGSVSLMRRPIIEFNPANARAPLRFRSSLSTSWPFSHDVGESVSVVYLASDPTRARIDSFFGNWVAPLVLLLFGAWIAIKRPELRNSRQWSMELD